MRLSQFPGFVQAATELLVAVEHLVQLCLTVTLKLNKLGSGSLMRNRRTEHFLMLIQHIDILLALSTPLRCFLGFLLIGNQTFLKLIRIFLNHHDVLRKFVIAE
ncbi:hypothetical protein D3C84_924310 [compost metagenome]